MKKLFILSILFFLIFPGIAFAMGSPQSTNPNGPNYVSPDAAGKAKAAKILANPALAAKIKYFKNISNYYAGLGQFSGVQKAIISAGPKMAVKLNNISGQIFGILTVLAFIWLMMPMWFKDIDWGAIVMFWVKVMMIYGMLRWYQYFWNEGIVGFFIYLKTQIGAQHMVYFTFVEFGKVLANIMFSFVGGGIWSILTGGGSLAVFLIIDILTLLIWLIALIMVIGMIFLVQIYIVIALVTGYIFIPFAVIKQGEFLFNGWLKFLISSAFSYFLIALVLKLFEIIFGTISLSSNPAVAMSLGLQLSILIVLVLFAYLVVKVPSLASEIISGTPNISVGGAAGVVVGAVGMLTGVGGLATAAQGGQINKIAGALNKFKKYNKAREFAKKPGRFGGDEK